MQAKDSNFIHSPVFLTKKSSPSFSNSGNSKIAELSELLEEGVRDGVFPGAVALIASGESLVFFEAKGLRRHSVGISQVSSFSGAAKTERTSNPSLLPMNTDTIFDVAALTAGVVTTTILMRLIDTERVSLDERVSRYLDGFGVLGKSPITLRHLLSHTAGLPSWYPFFEELLRDNAASRLGILTTKGAHDYVITTICRSPIRGDIGSKSQYSDVGMIVLGALIENLTALSLDRAFYKFVAKPLGLKNSSFIDLSEVRRGTITPYTDIIAPTEECSWRKRVLCGEVHDDNAWMMGGIAGHSGLFTSAKDLHIIARELRRALRGESSFLSANIANAFLAPGNINTNPSTGASSNGFKIKLGWDSPSRENGLNQVSMSEKSFGYNGFTGCALWIDPEKNCDIILLTNRIFPTRLNKKISAFRAAFVQSALKIVEDKS
jgi:CubicO group peptidase (beta-lactamase class C family)